MVLLVVITISVDETWLLLGLILPPAPAAFDDSASGGITLLGVVVSFDKS